MSDPAVVPAVLAGAAIGGLAMTWVSWHLWWLLGRPPALAQRVQQRRQRAKLSRRVKVAGSRPGVEVEDAGHYVQAMRAEGTRAGWGQLEPPEGFTRVR